MVQVKKNSFGDDTISVIKKKVSKKNLELIEKFLSEHKAAKDVTQKRIDRLRLNLIRIAYWLKKDFSKAKKDDIVKLVNKIESHGYKKWTQRGYRGTIKVFYKWYAGDGEFFPPIVSWLKLGKAGNKVLPERLLTEEDVMNLVDTATHPRDKALIFILYESGFRIGELLNMKVGDIEFENNGARITVSGKTGHRRVLLTQCVPLLSTWLDQHPEKNNPDAPVWICWGKRNYNNPMNYITVHDVLTKVKEDAQLKKPINPHHFRHSRASSLAKHLTEAQMCQYFGWGQGSDMPSIYVHLSGRDTDGAILKANGMEVDEEKEESKLKPQKCMRCTRVNSATSKFCNGCGFALDMNDIVEKNTDMEQLLLRMAEHYQVLNRSQIKKMEKKMKGEVCKTCLVPK